jgi:ParB-like chromosome segregation protein Spo0J
MALRIVYRLVSDIYPDPMNTRIHPDAQVEQIAASILEFGFTNPILISPANQIIAGEGRWLGAQRAGLVEIPCVELDGLSEQQRRAYVIADNRIGLNSTWDWSKLESELTELLAGHFDVDVLAFSDAELESLLSSGDVFPDNSAKPPKRKKEQPAAPQLEKGVSKIVHTCPNCGHTFN